MILFLFLTRMLQSILPREFISIYNLYFQTVSHAWLKLTSYLINGINAQNVSHFLLPCLEAWSMVSYHTREPLFVQNTMQLTLLEKTPKLSVEVGRTIKKRRAAREIGFVVWLSNKETTAAACSFFSHHLRWKYISCMLALAQWHKLLHFALSHTPPAAIKSAFSNMGQQCHCGDGDVLRPNDRSVAHQNDGCRCLAHFVTTNVFFLPSDIVLAHSVT
jgi:hypothetical protein